MEQENIPENFEHTAKVLAATALSQSFSFCMERKYLQHISDDRKNDGFGLEIIPQTLKENVSWIEINQVGKPLDEEATSCFTAIQKILYSCFLPRETQLLFLVTGNEKQSKMYLGVRPIGNEVKKNIVRYLNDFLKGVWPGLQTKIVTDEEQNEGLKHFKKNVENDSFEYMYALTGIPSMESQYKSTYPATIDKLMAGMRQSKNYAYLVVADPVENEEIEGVLFQCREMNGQAESLKSFNFSESNQEGISQAYATSYSQAYSKSKSVQESTSKKDYSGIGKLALTGAGLGLAASFFPAAHAVLEGTANATGTLLTSAAGLYGLSGIVNSFIPTKTTSHSKSESYTDTTSRSQTDSVNESQSKSISRNIVNKHIEAVTEHLFYHSKRLETGKATGMWKVGVYLMAGREADIKGASLQLRSILSGQETIFEPIRIHDITTCVEQVKGETFAQYSAPTIMINSLSTHKRFNHPLGDAYKELRTVLTTKELSYLINFPLSSVPGISVIDSSPEFCLNQQESTGEQQVELGKLLYGGSLTHMNYSIPVNMFSRHILLSGINGSGKTNTVHALLNHFAQKLPFLVIEPAKTEYVDWALNYNKKHPEDSIQIFIPGCKRYKTGFTPVPLKLNPFELVWLDREQEPNVLAHIDRLKSTFAAAFPMYDILPVLMEDLLYTVYQNKTTDWLSSEPVFGETLPPTLNSMSVSIEKVVNNRAYEERIERNMKACLNTRIDSLKRGWKGEMLNTVHSTSWQELFEKKCIINLSYVGDDVDKAFFMALILQFLYEYRTACVETGNIDFNDNNCRHLTVIEEAHRVMSKCEQQDLPQYKSAMMFSNMLSEIRAYGEGMLLVDQIPTRLIPDAIKNTNLKITHRLVAEDDCKAVSESMGLSKEQRKILPKLLTGQCIISSSLSTEAYWVKVDKVK